MTERRFFRAFFKTVLFFAIFHFILLIVLTVVTQRIEYLNIFEIVGLSHFFPGIQTGIISFIISTGIVAATYFLYYHRAKRKG